jgi:hypothetical protein
MSIFDEAKSEETQPQEAQTTPEQTQQEEQPSDSYLQKLVETRGDNWKDPEVLAKGKLEADEHIKNLETQLTQMREDLSTEARTILVNKSQELGISVERMQELAAESPSAFFALIGEKQQTFKPITQGSVRTEAVGVKSGGERDFNYYQTLRRENRGLYYTPKIQQQMMEDRQRLGDRFGV